MQHNVFDQGQLDFVQERNALFIGCFFKHTSSLLILYPFYFCLQRQTSSVVRMLWDYRKPAQACKQARTSCLSCCILFGGMGGKHWETSLELLLIPNIMFLLCAQNHTPVFQKKLRILSQTWRQRWRRVRERKKEEKTLVTWRGKIVHRAAVMLVQKAREGNKQKHIEGGKEWETHVL